jgi:predicted lipoprotein with Yx(FWY)xxD motif
VRYLSVLILKKDGTTEWRNIGWGKYYLDQVRKEGDILMSFINYS